MFGKYKFLKMSLMALGLMAGSSAFAQVSIDDQVSLGNEDAALGSDYSYTDGVHTFSDLTVSETGDLTNNSSLSAMTLDNSGKVTLSGSNALLDGSNYGVMNWSGTVNAQQYVNEGTMNLSGDITLNSNDFSPFVTIDEAMSTDPVGLINVNGLLNLQSGVKVTGDIVNAYGTVNIEGHVNDNMQSHSIESFFADEDSAAIINLAGEVNVYGDMSLSYYRGFTETDAEGNYIGSPDVLNVYGSLYAGSIIGDSEINVGSAGRMQAYFLGVDTLNLEGNVYGMYAGDQVYSLLIGEILGDSTAGLDFGFTNLNVDGGYYKGVSMMTSDEITTLMQNFVDNPLLMLPTFSSMTAENIHIENGGVVDMGYYWNDSNNDSVISESELISYDWATGVSPTMDSFVNIYTDPDFSGDATVACLLLFSIYSENSITATNVQVDSGRLSTGLLYSQNLVVGDGIGHRDAYVDVNSISMLGSMIPILGSAASFPSSIVMNSDGTLHVGTAIADSFVFNVKDSYNYGQIKVENTGFIEGMVNRLMDFMSGMYQADMQLSFEEEYAAAEEGGATVEELAQLQAEYDAQLEAMMASMEEERQLAIDGLKAEVPQAVVSDIQVNITGNRLFNGDKMTLISTETGVFFMGDFSDDNAIDFSQTLDSETLAALIESGDITLSIAGSDDTLGLTEDDFTLYIEDHDLILKSNRFIEAEGAIREVGFESTSMLSGMLRSSNDSLNAVVGLRMQELSANDMNNYAGDQYASMASDLALYRNKEADDHVWIQGYGEGGKFDHKDAGYETSMTGLAIGYDTRVSKDVVVGVVGSYGSATIEGTTANYQTDAIVYQLGAYGLIEWDNQFVNTLLSYGVSDYDQMNGGASASFSGNVLSAQATYGQHFELAPTINVTPYASATYTEVALDNYADGTAVVLSDVQKSTELGFGANLSTVYALKNKSSIIPVLNLEYGYDVEGENTDLGNVDTGGTVLVKTPGLGNNVFRGGLTMLYKSVNGYDLSVGYRYKQQGDYSSHGVVFKGKIGF